MLYVAIIYFGMVLIYDIVIVNPKKAFLKMGDFKYF